MTGRSTRRGHPGSAKLSLRTAALPALVTALFFGCGTSPSGSGPASGAGSDGGGSNPSSTSRSSASGGSTTSGGGGASSAGASGGASSGPPGGGSDDATTPPPDASMPADDGSSGPASDVDVPSDAPTIVPQGNRVRTLASFDDGWLFKLGDITGADQASFADGSWRALRVPHDWSIEGPTPPSSPFSATAPTTGRGAYAPAGVGWYRKHFALPQSLSGRRIFVEFDGVMANSDVYINGFHLGKRPYGYVSFRYDTTGHVTFGGTDNVLAVRCDNSVQPASRFYTGGGIYRHVRLIGTDPVHVDQWATYVTTPAPSATSATVHVQTSVVNDGASAASVSVQGIVTDPGGTSLAPVTAAATSIAAGAAAAFTFDVPVANPKLWDTASPNMYALTTNVQVGGSTVDDDVTPFGIRSLTFSATSGMSLNGKSVKFKGVCMHHDVSGLGAAVPMRAWQRRLAQFKALGANAIRTSHNPVAPEVLDLADRMGFLVLDEFFDAWNVRKYADVGDYAAYFAATATPPFGSPSAGAGAPWWQTDLTDIVMRDRNHPSVALYSIGNEIHDSLAVRTPIATKMVAMCHQLDPSRSVTQALIDPQPNGDVAGATRTIVDVFGANYDVAGVNAAMAMAPARAGVMTEIGHQTSTWTTIMNTPALTGEFIWTGIDYLGEADGLWPIIGKNPGAGLMDRVGTIRSDGYTYQRLWGGASSAAPATGTTATKVALTADHPAILADPNDVAYVKATIADASGNVVTSAANPVTFSITGPGAIVAVDSGSPTQETFRGNIRSAFQGLCFAIVQATAPGTITVTAAASGLTGSSVTLQGSAGTFVPCAGGCN